MSKSPSLRRIQADIRELSIDPSDRYHAAPLEDDMFEWHFTIRGAIGTEFENGIYHGRILLPAEYPFKPPNIVFLTPSGRFETGTKVCLSFSAYHPELWQPAWGVRLILEALISFLPTPADGAIGALDWTKDERKRLAKKSINFCCARCGNVANLLPKQVTKVDVGTSSSSSFKFQKEIEQLYQLQIATEQERKTKNKKKEQERNKNSDDDADADDSVAGVAGVVDDNDNANVETVNSVGQEEKPPPPPTTTTAEDEDKKMAKSNEGVKGDDDNNNNNNKDGTTFVADKNPPQAAISASTNRIGMNIQEENNTKITPKMTMEEQKPTLSTNSNMESVSTQEMDPPPPPQQQQQQAILTPEQHGDSESINTPLPTPPPPPLLSDPIIHVAILIFAMIVILLYRKANALLEDLSSIEENNRA